MDINKIRQETPFCEDLIHFNNAGSSLKPSIVNESIIEYLNAEAKVGGYELEADRSETLQEVHTEVAKLIDASFDEIALTENATNAFFKALFSIDFNKDDEILTSELEYGNNFISFLRLKKQTGLKITVVPSNDAQVYDIDALKAAINSKTKLIAVTHMPTNSGAISPVEEIGRIAKEHGILYLIDTCQSVGQYPLDVHKLHCHFLTGTARKYLRGPRGLGFLYVRKEVLPFLEPISIEMSGATWTSQDSYEKIESVKMFEAWEQSRAISVGMKHAVRYANNIGIQNIWSRIQELSSYARDRFEQIPGITLHDGLGPKSGIISLTKDGVEAQSLQAYLRSKQVNSSISQIHSSRLHMQSKNLTKSNRLSVHYYNTKSEIIKVAELLERFT